jgi:hypothetical protein
MVKVHQGHSTILNFCLLPLEFRKVYTRQIYQLLLQFASNGQVFCLLDTELE